MAVAPHGSKPPQAGAQGTPRASDAPSTKPGFALRFEAGRGIVSLARPLALTAGTLACLEMDLGRLPSPIDLRAGAIRFRHRRAIALRGEVRLDLDVLSAAMSSQTAEVRVLSSGGEQMTVALRDP